MNNLTVSGNVGADPQFKIVGENETPMLSFPLAFNFGYGEKKVTTWMACTIWGKRADSIQTFIKKGDSLVISGEIWLRKWADERGQNGAQLEMNVHQVVLPQRNQDKTTDALPV